MLQDFQWTRNTAQQFKDRLCAACAQRAHTDIQIEVGKLVNSIVAHEQSIIIDKRELAVLELRLATFKKDGVPWGGHHLPKKTED